MIRSFAFSAATLTASGLSAIAAGDPTAGRQRVVNVCQECHGMDGLSRNIVSPNLSGQVEDYLAKALADFRSGTRKHPAMNNLTRLLSDQDIADLAAYYSAIKIQLAPP
jgi:cytochrome c553